MIIFIKSIREDAEKPLSTNIFEIIYQHDREYRNANPIYYMSQDTLYSFDLDSDTETALFTIEGLDSGSAVYYSKTSTEEYFLIGCLNNYMYEIIDIQGNIITQQPYSTEYPKSSFTCSIRKTNSNSVEIGQILNIGDDLYKYRIVHIDYRTMIAMNYFDLDDISEYNEIIYEPYIYINNFKTTQSNNYLVIGYFHNHKTKIRIINDERTAIDPSNILDIDNFYLLGIYRWLTTHNYILIYGIDYENNKVSLRNFNDFTNLANNTEMSLFSNVEVYHKNFISITFIDSSTVLVSNYVNGNVYLYSYSYNYENGWKFNFKINFLYLHVYKFFIYANNIRNIYLFTKKYNGFWKQIHLKNKNTCRTNTINAVINEGFVIDTSLLKSDRETLNTNIIVADYSNIFPDFLMDEETGNNYLILNKNNIPSAGNLRQEFRLFVISTNIYADEENLNKCNLTLRNICNQACKTCSAYSYNPQDPKCDTCADNYELINGKCFNSSQTFEGYYYSDGEYIPCHENCKTCSGSGESNCLTCWKEYGIYQNKCIPVDTTINYYYFDVETSSFKQCMDNCFTCINSETCDMCDSYYCYKDNTCYYYDVTFEGLYCDLMYGYYMECDESCLSCYDYDKDNCLSCDSSRNLALYLETCIDKSTIIEGYYYDSNTNSFLACESPCKTCSESKSNCSSCIDNYCLYSNECIINTTVIPNYHCNSNNIYEKCSDNCFSCDSTSCLYCLSDYGLYNGQCYHKNTKIEAYFFDYEHNTFTKCSAVCKTCYGNLSNNCLSCYDEYILVNKQCITSEFLNEKYYYDDTTNSYEKCHSNCLSCYGPLSSNCLSCNINYNLYNDSCYSNFSDYISTISEKEDILSILGNNSDALNNNTVYSLDDYKIQILNSSSESLQISEKTPNISTIYLGQCEDILKQKYNINDNESLTIIVLEYKEENNDVNTLNFRVLFNNTLLNLSFCDGINIVTSSPLTISSEDASKLLYLEQSGYDILNSSNEFYNDGCSLFTSENGTDVILERRKTDYYLNLSLCEENCQYNGINSETMKVNCICDFNSSKEEFNYIKNELSDSFLHVFKYSNLKVIVCYSKFFTYQGFFKNYGNWIMIFLILCFLIIIIFFFMTGLSPLLANIHEEINKLKNRKKIQKKTFETDNEFFKVEEENKTNNPPKKSNSKKSENNNFMSTKEYNIKNSLEEEQYENNINFDKDDDNNFNYQHNSLKSSMKIINDEDNYNYKPSKFKNNEPIIYEDRKLTEKDLKLKSNENIQINKEKYSDEELNDMEFSQAFLYDDRNFWQMYWSLVKYDQLIIFTFFTKHDFNLRLLKIELFILSFSLYLTISALFYSDDSIDYLYRNNGKFSFIYTLPQTIFSTICCDIITCILQCLTLSQNKIQDLNKNVKNLNEYEIEIKKIIKSLKIKIVIFTILGFILLGLFWYYVSVFCAVYYNTQISFIKSVCMNFAWSMLDPFYLCIFSPIFRMIAIKKHVKCCYWISKILQQL